MTIRLDVTVTDTLIVTVTTSLTSAARNCNCNCNKTTTKRASRRLLRSGSGSSKREYPPQRKCLGNRWRWSLRRKSYSQCVLRQGPMLPAKLVTVRTSSNFDALPSSDVRLSYRSPQRALKDVLTNLLLKYKSYFCRLPPFLHRHIYSARSISDPSSHRSGEPSAPSQIKPRRAKGRPSCSCSTQCTPPSPSPAARPCQSSRTSGCLSPGWGSKLRRGSTCRDRPDRRRRWECPPLP